MDVYPNALFFTACTSRMAKKTYPVSIIIPCLNEQSFIEQVINDILKQTYPLHQLEIICIDGGSTDKTISIIQKYQQKHRQIRLLKNPGRYVSHALNHGIRSSSGDIIIRMDAHSSYPPFYISKLLFWLKKTNADNVGGSWYIQSRKDQIIGKAIASMLGHPFSMDFAAYRNGLFEYEEEVDTIPYGCFYKSTFDKYGWYDERLARHQNTELNKRISDANGRILLVPNVHSIYYTRHSYIDLWKDNYGNGKWRILAARITNDRSLNEKRHYIPLFVVLYTIVAIVISLFIPFTPLSIFVFFPTILYFLLIARASLSISIERDKLEYLPFLLIAFTVVHVSYGIGTLRGLLSRKTPKQEDFTTT